MPYAVMGSSIVVTPTRFRLAAAGIGTPGDEVPGAAVLPCCCVVMMGATGTCVVAAYGAETGRCGAANPVLVVAGGIWAVEPMVVTIGSVNITCYSVTMCRASD